MFFVDVKKRNVIPLVRVSDEVSRIVDVSDEAKEVYSCLEVYNDT